MVNTCHAVLGIKNSSIANDIHSSYRYKLTRVIELHKFINK